MSDGKGTLVAHFRHSFRDRVMEWYSAAALTSWGVLLLLPAKTFDNPFYIALARIFPEEVWGVLCLAGGVARLTVLAINGFWLPSYRLRSVFAFLSIFFWMQISLSVFWANPYSTGLSTYPWLMLADIYAVYRAALDYRLAHAIRKVNGSDPSRE